MQPQEIQHNDTPLNFMVMPSPTVMQLGNQASYQQTETATSKPALEFLLFDTNYMSMERAHTLLWLALHQLWILSWMSVESERPKPIRLNIWLKAVRQSEADLQKELRGKRPLPIPVSITEADRLLCANDLFHIAGGMNRWMMLEQRYKFLNTSKKWDLFYLIKPDIALSIHQYLDSTNLMDFRFRPGVPSSSSTMHQESWNSKNQNWKFVFKGFHPDLANAHRRFMIRLIRRTITTNNPDNDDADDSHDETLKKRKKTNLSKSTSPSKRTRLQPVSSPDTMCPLPLVDSPWQPASVLSTSKITKLAQSPPATRNSPPPSQLHHHALTGSDNNTSTSETTTSF